MASSHSAEETAISALPDAPAAATLGEQSGQTEQVSRPLDSLSNIGSIQKRTSLKTQFALIIFLLAFLPNVMLTAASSPNLPSTSVLGWMLVVAMMCGTIGYMLSGTLLRPLHRLEDEVLAGEFTQQHPDDPSEVESLRVSFNDLLNRLRTEQARRNAFMATLVHDLKTPLIATGHLTQVLTTLPLSEEERGEIGSQIQSETHRLLGLVQQMSDAHRFEYDDFRLQTNQVDLGQLAQRVVERLSVRADSAKIELSYSGSGHADVDSDILERAIINLTENALRYAKTQIHLCVSSQGISVQDDGPGLNAPLEELAQPFVSQAATIAGKQYTAGTAGLGLFIVRRVAESHGGSLSYQRSHVTHAPPSDITQPQPPFTHFTIHLPEVNQ